ncbi:MAG: hypothetical protein JNM18_05235 [Planctomycetaceae bacterium]|nr:hypothetical protein [Planctomycetaceae bacterium]
MSLIFTVCGIGMIVNGDNVGWLVAGFFALCLLIALLKPYLLQVRADHGKLAFIQHEPIQVCMSRSFMWPKSIEVRIGELKAGSRLEIVREEIDRAVEYAHLQWARDLRFPKEGEIYEAISDTKIQYMTSHHAPYTGGGEAVLAKGERVRVSSVSHEKPIGVYCDPLRYDELHEEIVSEEERNYPSYDGYYFSIDTVDLNRFFRIVNSEEDETSVHVE